MLEETVRVEDSIAAVGIVLIALQIDGSYAVAQRNRASSN